MLHIPDEFDARYLYNFLFALSSAWPTDLAQNSVMLFELEPETDPEPYINFLKSRHYIEIGEVRLSGTDYTYFRITDQGRSYTDDLLRYLRS